MIIVNSCRVPKLLLDLATQNVMLLKSARCVTCVHFIFYKPVLFQEVKAVVLTDKVPEAQQLTDTQFPLMQCNLRTPI